MPEKDYLENLQPPNLKFLVSIQVSKLILGI